MKSNKITLKDAVCGWELMVAKMSAKATILVLDLNELCENKQEIQVTKRIKAEVMEKTVLKNIGGKYSKYTDYRLSGS